MSGAKNRESWSKLEQGYKEAQSQAKTADFFHRAPLGFCSGLLHDLLLTVNYYKYAY